MANVIVPLKKVSGGHQWRCPWCHTTWHIDQKPAPIDERNQAGVQCPLATCNAVLLIDLS